MIVKQLTEQHLEFLSLKGGCRGSSESSLHLSKCQIVGNLVLRLINVIIFVTSCTCRKHQTDKWKYKNKAHVNRFTTVEQEAQKRKDIKHTKKQVRSWSKDEISKLFKHKIVSYFLTISLNMCFGCSQHMFWLRNENNNSNMHSYLAACQRQIQQRYFGMQDA